MSSKDLKINIITDASGVVTLSKGVGEVDKNIKAAATSAETLSKRLEDAKTVVQSFANKSAQAYTDLNNKIALYNDRIVEGGRSGALAWGNAQASAVKYNNELQKAITLQKELQVALSRGLTGGIGGVFNSSSAATDKGYKPNASGTVADNRAKAAEVRETQLLNQALTQEKALRERLAISAKAYLDRINAVEVAKAAQQSRLLNESLAKEAAIRERTTLAARAYLARVAEVNALVAQTRTRNEQIASSYQDIINKLTMTTRAYEATRLAAQGFSQAQIQNIQHLQASSNALQDHERHTRNLFLRVGEAIGAYRIWNTLLNGIFNAPVSVTKIGIELEATQSILQSTMGSAAGAAGAMKFLDQEAARTGITIHTLRTSWRDFSASTTLAGMGLNTTAKMFGELNTVITALHLSTDRTQGVFNAMAQIFNKGKVQSEELVKQLGNLLPGAFASFAAATGRTTRELSIAMKKGEVAARELVDFTTYMSDKFAASFGLASQGMNANIGRMQSAFTHLGETFYGLSSGAIVSVVKGITSLTNKMSDAIGATKGYGNGLIQLKSILEGVFIVTLGNALLNVNKLKVALALVTVPNLLLAGLAAAASYIAYMYNKVQAPLDKLKEAQAQIAESRAQGLFEDKTISIAMRIENAEPIRKAVKELEDLMAAKKDFEQQNEHLAKRTPYSVEHNSIFAAEQASYTRDKTAFEDTIKEKAALIERARVAERIKMEAFAAEDAKRQSAITNTNDINSAQNLKQIREQLRDSKLLLDDKLHILDIAGKEEERITKEKLSVIENLHAQHKITEQEQLTASNTIYEQSFARRKQLLEEKLAFEQQGKNSLGLDAAYKSKLITEDELNILEAYGKAMTENTATVTASTVAFEVASQGKVFNIDLAKTEIEQLQEKADKVEKLTDTTKRGIAIDRQILDTKDQLKKLESDESIRKEKAATASVQASKNTLDALDQERIKYLELTGEIQKAIEAKSKLALKNNLPYQQAIQDSNSPNLQVATTAKDLVKTTDTNVELAKLQETNKAATDYKESLYAIDKATRDLGVTSTEAFDIVNGGMGSLLTAFSNLSNAVNKASDDLHANEVAQQRIRDKVVLSLQDKEELAKLTKRQSTLETASQVAAVSGYRQMAGAASKMFKENTAERKAFHTLETALSVIEMALSAKKFALELFGMAQSLGALVTTVAPTVAAEATKATAHGTTAVAAQGAIPFVGFALMAAMVAALAAIGIFTGGSSSASVPIPTSPDTGTVLGAPTASSESVGNTYELLKDIQSDNYPVLKSIDKGIRDLHSGITDVVTRLFQAGGLPNVTPPASKMTGIAGAFGSVLHANPIAFDPILEWLLGSMFGGKQTSTVTAQGISTGATSIADIMGGGNLSAQQFAQIETKTKGGWFTKDKFSTSTQYAALDADTQKALNGVFKSMGDTMLGLANNLGLGLSDRVKNYIIPALSVDLKGLDGEAAAKKLNGVISAALDTMSTTVFGDILGQYQQLGEGMLETAVRIVAQMAVVKDALATSGLTIAGDAIAVSNALVQAAGGLQEFQKQFESFYDKFFTDAEKHTRIQEQLNSQLSTVGLSLATNREGYRKLVEAVDLSTNAGIAQYSTLIRLSDTADDYYQSLESSTSAQHSLDIQLLEAQGKTLTALIIKRKDEIAAMEESLRATQYMIYAIQDLKAAQDSAATEANKTLDNSLTRLKTAVDAEKKVLTAKYNLEQEALKDSLVTTLAANEAQKKSTEETLNTLKQLASDLQAAIGSTALETSAYLQNLRTTAQNSLQAALDFAEAGNSLDKFKGISEALKIVAKPSEQLYSTFEEYATAQTVTGNVIAKLNSHAISQVSVGEATLKAIQNTATAAQEASKTQLKVLQDTYETENTRLEALVTTAQDQVALLRGTYEATLSIEEALGKVATALGLAKQTTAADNAITLGTIPKTYTEGATATGYQSSGSASYSAATGVVSGKTGDFSIADAIAFTNTSLAQGNPTQVYNSAKAAGVSGISLDKIMGWDVGTSNSWVAANKLLPLAVGANYIPHDMPALIHEGEMVVPAAYNPNNPNNKNKDSSISREILQELKLLRKNNEEQDVLITSQGILLASIAKSSGKTADILETNSANGGPMLVKVV